MSKTFLLLTLAFLKLFPSAKAAKTFPAVTNLPAPRTLKINKVKAIKQLQAKRRKRLKGKRVRKGRRVAMKNPKNSVRGRLKRGKNKFNAHKSKTHKFSRNKGKKSPSWKRDVVNHQQSSYSSNTYITSSSPSSIPGFSSSISSSSEVTATSLGQISNSTPYINSLVPALNIRQAYTYPVGVAKINGQEIHGTINPSNYCYLISTAVLLKVAKAYLGKLKVKVDQKVPQSEYLTQQDLDFLLTDSPSRQQLEDMVTVLQRIAPKLGYEKGMQGEAELLAGMLFARVEAPRLELIRIQDLAINQQGQKNLFNLDRADAAIIADMAATGSHYYAHAVNESGQWFKLDDRAVTALQGPPKVLGRDGITLALYLTLD